MLPCKNTSASWKRAKGGFILLALIAAFSVPSFSALAATDETSQQISATMAGISQPAQASQPELAVVSSAASWGTFSDYTLRILNVTSQISNTGINDAVNVQLLGSTTTANVALTSSLPLTLGDIRAGDTVSVVLKYQIPDGVSIFRRTIRASAYDDFGNYYTYPASTNSQSLGNKTGVSVGDNLASLSDAELENALTGMDNLGVKWIRFDMAWDLVQRNDANHYDWSRYDRMIAAANRHGLNMLPILAYTPTWARQQACAADFQCAPADPNKFAAFAHEAAIRYAPLGIKTWEIWNEPNINAFWLPSPNATAYTDLLKASYTAIKNADPQAKVISGGLSPAENTPGHIAPRDFLTAMYLSGAKNYLDAVGYHPYSFPALPGSIFSWSGWSQMSDLNPSMRSIMIANGDGDKQIWATEYGVPSGGQSDVNETLQALSYRDAINQMSNMPWMGALFIHTYKDFSNNPSSIESYFGMVAYNGALKPSYYELKNDLAVQ